MKMFKVNIAMSSSKKPTSTCKHLQLKYLTYTMIWQKAPKILYELFSNKYAFSPKNTNYISYVMTVILCFV